MSVGGAPLKPWEVARGGQPSNDASETLFPTQGKQETGTQGEIHTTQPTPTYSPYSGVNNSYASPYQTPRPYGSNYYGYPQTYGAGVYGGSYGTGGYGAGSYGAGGYGAGGYGAGSYGAGGYGGMYGYGRPAPWTQQPPHPGAVGPLPGGMPPKMPMWQRFLDGLQKVVHCFGRLSFLVDENTQAFHFFITALLAFLDKAGSLYGEIARYVMRLLGFGRRSKNSRQPQGKVNSAQVLKTLWKKQ